MEAFPQKADFGRSHSAIKDLLSRDMEYAREKTVLCVKGMCQDGSGCHSISHRDHMEGNSLEDEERSVILGLTAACRTKRVYVCLGVVGILTWCELAVRINRGKTEDSEW